MWKLLRGAKCLSNKEWRCFLTLVTTFALYGGLHHTIFPFWFLVVVVFYLMFCWYCIWCLYLAFVTAFFCGLAKFLGISSLANNCDKIFRNKYFIFWYIFYIFFMYFICFLYILDIILEIFNQQRNNQKLSETI